MKTKTQKKLEKTEKSKHKNRERVRKAWSQMPRFERTSLVQQECLQMTVRCLVIDETRTTELRSYRSLVTACTDDLASH